MCSIGVMIGLAAAAWFAASPLVAMADNPSPVPGGAQLFFPPYVSASERLGFGLAGGIGDLAAYDVASLNAGWYLNWGTAQDPPHPSGLVYVQVIRLKGPFRSCLRACNAYQPTCAGIIDYLNCRPDVPADPAAVSVSPSREVIQQIARAQPGSLWLIGNEQDRITYMDDVCPDEYAMVYHELYQLIKQADPTAKITIGGVVQATPIRLQYLDIVMCSYQNLYGSRLPADVWNVHGFVLNEERNRWGCDIPPGMVSLALAQQRQVWQIDDFTLFKQQIRSFRQWMATHGEREKPLIVSEYGILMPEKWNDGSWACDGDPYHDDPLGRCAPGNGRPYDYARVTSFMQASFNYFLGLDPEGSDANLGYSADGNRLVQAWNWYSLNDDWLYGGNLFTSGSKQITPLGQDFAGYAGPRKASYIDLSPFALSLEHRPDVFAGDPVTVTISSQIFNMGNQAASDVAVRFWQGQPGLGTQLGSDQLVTLVPPRYQGSLPTAAVTWATVASDAYDLYVQVDPDNRISESVKGNNTISATLDFKSDLVVDSLGFNPRQALLANGQPVAVTITASVRNIGHLAAINVGVRAWDGDPDSGGVLIGNQTVAASTADPLGRYEQAAVQFAWLAGTPGLHQIYVRVDPDNVIAEADESNNQRVGTILLAKDRIFLPLILEKVASAVGASADGFTPQRRIVLPIEIGPP